MINARSAREVSQPSCTVQVQGGSSNTPAMVELYWKSLKPEVLVPHDGHGVPNTLAAGTGCWPARN